VSLVTGEFKKKKTDQNLINFGISLFKLHPAQITINKTHLKWFVAMASPWILAQHLHILIWNLGPILVVVHMSHG